MLHTEESLEVAIFPEVNYRRSDDSCYNRKSIRFYTEAFHNPGFENLPKGLCLLGKFGVISQHHFRGVY